MFFYFFDDVLVFFRVNKFDSYKDLNCCKFFIVFFCFLVVIKMGINKIVIGIFIRIVSVCGEVRKG